VTAARHLSVSNRRASWLRQYPTAEFWEPWHMAVLSHGGLGSSPPPVTFMAPLYHPAVKHRNPASLLLLSFEQRTLLGYLPGQMTLDRGVPAALLEACIAAEVDDLAAFWNDLPGHVVKHLNAAEGPHLNAVARAVGQELRSRGVDTSLDPDVFPAAITDSRSYAALARMLLLVALLPDTPFQWRAYCPAGHFVPYSALTLNIDVPESFFVRYGESGQREVMLGLNLAVAEVVSTMSGQVLIPVLSSRVSFSTLFAPTTPESSKVRRPGSSSQVFLR